MLAQLWLLDPLPAWPPAGGQSSRPGSTPQHHLADPAIAARLLGVGVDPLLDGSGASSLGRRGPMPGALFESLVTLGVRVHAQAAEAEVSHPRTRDGDHEVDLVVHRADQRVVAMEVKLAGGVDDHDVRHLRWLASRLGEDLLDAVVVTTGRYAHRRRDGTAVVPAAPLGP